MDRFESTILIGPRIDTFITQTFTAEISRLIVVATSLIFNY